MLIVDTAMKKLLAELKANNVQISLDGKDLKIQFLQDELPSDLITRLRSRKSDIVEYLQHSSKATADDQQIQPVALSSNGYPLSSAQKRLWILDRYEDGLAAYNISQQVSLNGKYDLESFQKAIYLVIERHEILRTIFRKNEAGEVRQWIIPIRDFNFEIGSKDFSCDADAAVDQFIQADISRPFDLEDGPLIRAFLLRTGKESHTFYYAIHHIIGDAWSLQILAKDVMYFYQAIVAGRPPQLVPLNIQYKDYASWQMVELKKNIYQEHQTFWKEYLRGYLPVLSLPSEKLRPSTKTQSGIALEMYLSEELTAEIKSFTREQGSSLFMTLLAICNVLLYRYSGQREQLIGSPVSGRNHADLENQIGFYVNTVVLKSNIDPQLSFLLFLQQIKDQVLAVLAHQDYPFDYLLDDLNLQRDVSRSPLFDVMIALQNSGEHNIEGIEDIVENQVIDKGQHLSKFDLEINFAELSGRLLFHLNFNNDIYNKTIFFGFMNHFVELTKSILADVEQPIVNLRSLSNEEETHLTASLNNCDFAFPQEVNIIDLFAEQVQKWPDKVALTDDGNTFTYQQLDVLSNQFGHYLQQQYSLREEELIGVLLEPNAWVVVTILGILKTGSAYVPMGIDHPEERLSYIRQDTSLQICIDADFLQAFTEQLKILPKESLNQSIVPENLAYVIYTSGTTGLPKGVLIEHRNVVRLFFHNQPLFDFNESDIWCLFHSYYFDFSVWEIFGALLFGGKLVVIPRAETRDLTAFADRLIAEKITVLNQTPTVFEQLQKILLSQRDINLPLRYLIFGGEGLVTSTLRDWKNRFPGCRIINMYGITETTVHVTYKVVGDREIAAPESNIGQPIPTLGCIVLDEGQQLVPAPVIGELYVYGPGLARGYLNQPKLTAQRFLELSLSGLGPIRLYRTGDLVKRNIEGELIYCGRMDNQVKIRGHRIELGEIEYYLLKKPGIRKAIVLSTKNDAQQNELVAYLVAPKAQAATDLRTYLASKIPAYAIPTYFVQVPDFPLTTNGKIDERKLPTPKNNVVSTSSNYTGARDETEKALVNIFARHLGRNNQEVSIHDNFFDLGANSLKLLSILDEINREFNRALKPLTLFQYTTIYELVTHKFRQEESTANPAIETSNKAFDFMED